LAFRGRDSRKWRAREIRVEATDRFGRVYSEVLTP